MQNHIANKEKRLNKDQMLIQFHLKKEEINKKIVKVLKNQIK